MSKDNRRNIATPTSLREIIQRRAELLAERGQRERAHKEWIATCDAQLEDLRESEALLVRGIDLDRLARGLHVIEVVGDASTPVIGRCPPEQRSYGDRDAVVAEAKQDIANGAVRLRHTFFGVKNYARFGDQRSDHPYRTAPRHGHIVFYIGLTRAVRVRISTIPLTAQEIEDALYVLANLSMLEQARGGTA